VLRLDLLILIVWDKKYVGNVVWRVYKLMIQAAESKLPEEVLNQNLGKDYLKND